MELPDSEFRIAEKMIRRMALKVKAVKKRRSVQIHEPTDRDGTYDYRNILDYRKNDNRIKELSVEKFKNIADEGQYRVMKIDGAPDGFYIIAGALTITAQLALAKQALEEFSNAKHTNLTNLTTLSRNQRGSTESSITACSDEKERNLWIESVKENGDFTSFNTLRWASLGYHYDWTRRMYQENVKSDFPPNLAHLCKHLASLVGESMHAEAAIVNFYPTGTYMSGHLDDAEHVMNEPIVSISLGTPAIFLLGGKTKNDIPTAILIRSGDVIIMAKDSRYSYHGVPAILPHNFEKILASQDTHKSNSNDFSIGNTDAEKDQSMLTPCCDICKLFLQTDQNSSEHSLTSTDCDQCQQHMTLGKECSSTTQNITNGSLENKNSCGGFNEKKCFLEVDNYCKNEMQICDIKSDDPILKYLNQGRININVRRVAIANTSWVDKCGSGAS